MNSNGNANHLDGIVADTFGDQLYLRLRPSGWGKEINEHGCNAAQQALRTTANQIAGRLFTMNVYQLKEGRWGFRYLKERDPERPGTTVKYFGRGPEVKREAKKFNQSLGFGVKIVHQESPLFIELANSYLDGQGTNNDPNQL